MKGPRKTAGITWYPIAGSSKRYPSSAHLIKTFLTFHPATTRHNQPGALILSDSLYYNLQDL